MDAVEADRQEGTDRAGEPERHARTAKEARPRNASESEAKPVRPPGAPQSSGSPRVPAASRETAQRRRGWRRAAWVGARAGAPELARRAGAPVAGSGWTGDRRRRCSYPDDGARDRRTGVRRGRKPSPSTGERPCCVDPSDQPFDWSPEPSGDTPRVTQSAAVCRHIPVAVWRRSNGSFAPHDRSCANLPTSACAISNSDICPVFFWKCSLGEHAFRRDFALSSRTREAFPRAS